MFLEILPAHAQAWELAPRRGRTWLNSACSRPGV
ncbi:hypothetical protein A2U01_0060497, partial [Trifolium medium]|nr:hypothetical protein [Trifolium medium]